MSGGGRNMASLDGNINGGRTTSALRRVPYQLASLVVTILMLASMMHFVTIVGVTAAAAAF
eukprot:scaffold140703_cov18-Prasinocladus_malaysianus.AAC.1